MTDAKRRAIDAYLCSTIIEPGYNYENYLEHLKFIKENGDNLDTWDLKQLKKVTDVYKINIKPENKGESLFDIVI